MDEPGDLPPVNQPEPLPEDAPPRVGAPTELADAQEIPEWMGNIVKAGSFGPLVIGLFCGGLPSLCGILACIGWFFI
ncbi:MAG: hypothetical protein ACLFTK_08710 [Anaerolineales bacterium]